MSELYDGSWDILRARAIIWKQRYYDTVEYHNNSIDKMVGELQAIKKMVQEEF